MASTRATIAGIRRLCIGGVSYDVPKFVHRHIDSASWSVVVGGIRRFFTDAAYGSTQAALDEAKYFLAQAVHEPTDALVQYANIQVIVHAPQNGKSAVYAAFRDQNTGKDMCLPVGFVRPGMDFWPEVKFSIQQIPSWLSGVDFSEVHEAWLSMHRKQLRSIYLKDEFRKIVNLIFNQHRQMELAI